MAANYICSLDGCGKQGHAKGLCCNHYYMQRRNGSPTPTRRSNGTASKWIDEFALPFKGDQCLIWPHSVDKDGYARGRYPGFKTDRAHRIVCWLIHGDPPTPDHEAAHSCGMGHEGCINPIHLSWATPAENTVDRGNHGNILKNESHPMAKLDANKARLIAGMLGKKTQAEIASIFGVTYSTVSLISLGKAWSDATGIKRKLSP